MGIGDDAEADRYLIQKRRIGGRQVSCGDVLAYETLAPTSRRERRPLRAAAHSLLFGRPDRCGDRLDLTRDSPYGGTMLRSAIVGLDGAARSLAVAIAELDNVEITAVADLFADKRARFIEQWERHPIPSDCKTQPSMRWPSLWGVNPITALTVDACNAGKARAGGEADGALSEAVRHHDRSRRLQTGSSCSELWTTTSVSTPQRGPRHVSSNKQPGRKANSHCRLQSV